MPACCALTKTGVKTVIPGNSSSPATPGTPAQPAYCAWVPNPLYGVNHLVSGLPA